MTGNRAEILDSLREVTAYCYPLRWADEATSRGDFDGRRFAIEVFEIDPSEQIPFLKKILDVRERAERDLGHRCLFIFHTRAATKEHYAHLFPHAEGLRFTGTDVAATLVGPLNEPGGCWLRFEGTANAELPLAA